MNLEEKILQKIRDEKIAPKPFWYFLVKDYSLWGLVFISIILAAICIAPIIFILQNLELDYAKHITGNIFSFTLIILPYPWIILCVITTYFATLAWERTKNGYKFDGKKVFVISFLVSLILGILLNMWNIGRKVDNEFKSASFGSYKTFEERRKEFWFDPNQGRILGTVDRIATSSFELVNEEKNFNKEIFFDENLTGKNNISEGKDVRVVGFENKQEENKFIACVIFPDDLPPEGRPLKKDREHIKKIKEEMKGRSGIHEECKKIFEKGRANFAK